MSQQNPLVDERALAAWMDSVDLAPCAPLTAARIPSGFSNEMFEVHRGELNLVLRRPAGVALERAEDGLRREHRVLAALDGTDVPHPPAIALCDDRDVLGCVFYLMGHVDGFLPVGDLPTPFATRSSHDDLAFAVVDALAALASVDWRERGLDDFGRPEGFHERQVERWLGQYLAYPAQELDGIDVAAEWLAEQRPAEWQPTIMHGDYHPGNLLVAPDLPPRVAAIVDWETATIGDPLLDLAGFLRFWFEAHPGDDWPDRTAMVARYEARTGIAVPDLAYHTVLAEFRLAVLVEGIYQRSKSDPTRALVTDLHTYGQMLVASMLNALRS